jgi:hypothetical protein
MGKDGDLLGVGPDTPSWVIRNLAKARAQQLARVAAARCVIRTNRLDGRPRASVGPDAERLSKAEQEWLADWAVQHCKERADRAEADLRGSLVALKKLERLLNDTFAFVLNHYPYQTSADALASAQKSIMRDMARRRKAAQQAESTAAPAQETPTRKRRGRKRTYDAAADSRLLRRFRDSLLTEKEFAKEIGMKLNALHLSLQRARSRAQYQKNRRA